MADLNAESRYPYNLDRTDILLGWQNDKMENILTYRDKAYQSKYSQAKTPKPSHCFMETLSDTFTAAVGLDGSSL